MCNEKEFTQAGFDAIAEAMHQLYPDQEGLYTMARSYRISWEGAIRWMAWRSGKARKVFLTGIM